MFDEKKLLKKRYRREDEKILVEVKLDNPKYLFDRKDPSPIKDRDLNEDVAEYIVSSIREIPQRYITKLCIYFKQGDNGLYSAERIKSAISNYFLFEAFETQKRFKQTLKLGLRSLLIGLSFLFLCIYMSKLFHNSAELFWNLVIEGLTVLGWVSMWYPINIFLYDLWPIRTQLKSHLRISEMEIEINYLELDEQ